MDTGKINRELGWSPSESLNSGLEKTVEWSGGSAAALDSAGLPVVEVAEITGFPEMMDGRVKTLHPRVHGGLLAVRGDPSPQAALMANGIGPIDLLIVNLYPFEATLKGDGSFEEWIENIDVGGPALVRGAAKNHAFVVVIVDVADYADLFAEFDGHAGGTGLAFRRRMAPKAYARTGAYATERSPPGSPKRPSWPRPNGAGVRHLRPGLALPCAALLREPAPGRRAFSDRRRGAAGRRDRAAGAGQGALL